MAVSTSRAPATIDKLVELWTAAAVAAQGTFTVWDGPLVTGDYGPGIHVGYDGDPEGDYKAVESDEEWAGIGAKNRDEEFDVICAAVALVGDNDVKLARDTVYSLLAVAATTLREDPSLAQTPSPFVAEFRPGPVYFEPSPNGLQVRGLFNVHVKTRLYTT